MGGGKVVSFPCGVAPRAGEDRGTGLAVDRVSPMNVVAGGVSMSSFKIVRWPLLPKGWDAVAVTVMSGRESGIGGPSVGHELV